MAKNNLEDNNIENIEIFKGKTALQNYKITMARHELSVIEIRIMTLVIFKLKEAQINGYNSDVEDISDLFTEISKVKIPNALVTIGTNYSQIKKALKSLNSRQIELKKDKGTYFFNLITSAYYSDDGSMIEIDIFPKIVPELVSLADSYTKFGLEFLFKTRSAHAIRWYQIGCHWLKNSRFYISKNDIKEIFKAEGRYINHTDFHKRLVAEPIEEVNNKSDIYLEIIETHKEGRNIVGYTIRVTQKATRVLENKGNKLPKFLSVYLEKFNNKIDYFCEKAGYSSEKLIQKLYNRGVPTTIKTQTHFNNQTDKYIILILSEEGSAGISFDILLQKFKEF